MNVELDAATAAPEPVTDAAGVEPGDDPACEALLSGLAGAAIVRRDVQRWLPPGWTAAGMAVLRGVAEAGPLRVGELAQRLHVDLSVASRSVAALVAAGLVEQTPDLRDRRAHVLRVTPSGERRLGQARRQAAQRLRDTLTDWDEAEVRTLADLLARLHHDFAHQSTARGGRR